MSNEHEPTEAKTPEPQALSVAPCSARPDFKARLRTLASWLAKRAEGNHNELTTRSMLRRKVDELMNAKTPSCEYCNGSGVVAYEAGGESRLDECGCQQKPNV
jgi:hypothetical protein